MGMLVATLAVAAATLPAGAAGVSYVPPHPGPVVRHFEPPPTPYQSGHRGIDIAAAPGSTVFSAAAGRIAFAGPVGGAVSISIDHADGIRTTYSYLSAATVRAGAWVARGAPIGRTGAGHPGSTGPAHVHVGARRGDTYLDVERIIVDALRRDYSPVVRLVPVPE